MYNLTVGVAQTFFVGNKYWLVHNNDRESYIRAGFAYLADVREQLGTQQRQVEIRNDAGNII